MQSRATSTQSAAVSGSIDSARRAPSARRSSVAAASGSFPASASLDRTSAQLTTLTAAPSPIASTTIDAPSSAWRTAIRAEASRTHAGTVSATAAPTNRRPAALGRCFRPAIGNQLVDQAAIRRNVGEKPPHPLRCGATPADLGLGELGCLCHRHDGNGRLGPGQQSRAAELDSLVVGGLEWRRVGTIGASTQIETSSQASDAAGDLPLRLASPRPDASSRPGRGDSGYDRTRAGKWSPTGPIAAM